MNQPRAGCVMPNFLTLDSDMTKFFQNIETADVIALTITFGVVMSNLANIKQQFMVPQALLIIIGYYFGRRIQKNGWH